ncbi:TolC family protein [Duganella sp. FT27W]|uniref:TolC family protein n=1 Tax=Duganella sp. FT27W TaxID=2654636 RepID=UPI00128E3F43|nr:TolC family protein [Duganella sp. FT27W]
MNGKLALIAGGHLAPITLACMTLWTSPTDCAARPSNTIVPPASISPHGQVFSKWLADPLSAMPEAAQRYGATADGTAPKCAEETNAASPLTLAVAVELAICRSPDLVSTWAGIKLRAGALGEARAAYLPTISTQASRQRTDSTNADEMRTSVRGYGMSIGMNWRLFDFGTRSAQQRKANELLLAALAEHDATLQKMFAETVQAYFDTGTARSAWQDSIHASQLAEQTVASAMRRESAGTASRGDALQAIAAHAKARLDQGRAHSAYDKLAMAFNIRMGRPVDLPLVLALDNDEENGEPGLETVSEDVVGDLNSWLIAARSHHPAMHAAQARWRAASAALAAAQVEGAPAIDLSINAYRNGYPGQGLSRNPSHVSTLGIAVSFPLFDGFARGYRIKQARAQEQQEQAVMDNTGQSIVLDVVNLHTEARTAISNLRASRQLIEAADEALHSVNRKYAGGVADIQELLTAERAASEAHRERTRCLAEWRAARMRLMASAGLLGFSLMQDATFERHD